MLIRGFVLFVASLMVILAVFLTHQDAVPPWLPPPPVYFGLWALVWFLAEILIWGEK